MQARTVQDRSSLPTSHVLRDGFSRWCFLSRAPRTLPRTVRRHPHGWHLTCACSLGDETLRHVGGFQEDDPVNPTNTSPKHLLFPTFLAISRLLTQRARLAECLNDSYSFPVSSPATAYSRLLGCLLAAAVAISNVSVAEAYNVRVEDVENPAMQAGGDLPCACLCARADRPRGVICAVQLPQQRSKTVDYHGVIS